MTAAPCPLRSAQVRARRPTAGQGFYVGSALQPTRTRSRARASAWDRRQWRGANPRDHDLEIKFSDLIDEEYTELEVRTQHTLYGLNAPGWGGASFIRLSKGAMFDYILNS